MWTVNLTQREVEYTKMVDTGYLSELTEMSAGSFIKCASFFSSVVGENAAILNETHRILMETEVKDKSTEKSEAQKLVDLTNDQLGIKK